LKPQPDGKKPRKIGGCGFQLRQGREADYIPYETLSSLTGWKDYWFYIGNHEPQLPDRTREAPKPAECWKEEIKEADMPHVRKLLEKIHERWEAGVTGATMMWSWLQRRIQPLQKRAHFGYQYLGLGDPSRLTSMEIFEPSGLKMLKKALSGVSAIPELPD